MSTSASLSELTQAISWLALGFRVPEDWEIVRHGVRFDAGSLVFVDRKRQRLSVSWTACPRAPDLERLLSDFGHQPLTVGESVVHQADRHGFRVLECEKHSGERVLHALRFDPLSNRLIELELPSCSIRGEETLAGALLGSFAFFERERGSCVRAFGVHASLPAGFALHASQVKPADATLEFERPARGGDHSVARIRVRRSGMARTWFDGDAARALRMRHPELSFDALAAVEVGPHAAVTARVSPRRAILHRAFGLTAPRHITFWECPQLNAVFEADVGLPRGADAKNEAPIVWCCREPAQESANDS